MGFSTATRPVQIAAHTHTASRGRLYVEPHEFQVSGNRLAFGDFSADGNDGTSVDVVTGLVSLTVERRGMLVGRLALDKELDGVMIAALPFLDAFPQKALGVEVPFNGMIAEFREDGTGVGFGRMRFGDNYIGFDGDVPHGDVDGKFATRLVKYHLDNLFNSHLPQV